MTVVGFHPRLPETGGSVPARRFVMRFPVASAACLDDRGRHGIGELHGDPVARPAGGREPAMAGLTTTFWVTPSGVLKVTTPVAGS